MSNPNQARKNAARRRREQTGESHQAAVRATQEQPPPVHRRLSAPMDGHTGWHCDTGASLIAEAMTPGPGKLGTLHGVIYTCPEHEHAAEARVTATGCRPEVREAPPGHRWDPWPCGHITAYAMAGTALSLPAGAGTWDAGQAQEWAEAIADDPGSTAAHAALALSAVNWLILGEDAPVPTATATRWVEDAALDAPDGHSWMRSAPDDCPRCPCHTARVCEDLLWLHADRPTNPDGTAYTKPCPCERAEEERAYNIGVTVGGAQYVVGASFLSGALYTERVWEGVSTEPGGGTAPVPLVMVLALPEVAGADMADQPRTTDGFGREWVQFPESQHAGTQYRITGLRPDAQSRSKL